MKLRIRRLDNLNWLLERFHPGGHPLPAGKAGVTKPRWEKVGYHSSLRRACLDLLQEAVPIGAVHEILSATDRSEIIDSLDRTTAALLSALESLPDDDRRKLDLGVIGAQLVVATLPEALESKEESS